MLERKSPLIFFYESFKSSKRAASVYNHIRSYLHVDLPPHMIFYQSFKQKVCLNRACENNALGSDSLSIHALCVVDTRGDTNNCCYFHIHFGNKDRVTAWHCTF